MTSSIFADVFVPAALAIIMLGIGLSLTTGDFRSLMRRPRALLTGVISQLIVFPLLGYACIALFQLPPAYAVGVMLLAACAGGAVAILIVNLAQGDTALVLALNAVSILWSAITIPLSLSLGFWLFGAEMSTPSLPLGGIVARVAAVTLLPVAFGMALRRLRPELARTVDKPLRLLSSLFLAILMVAILIGQYKELAEMVATLGPAMLTLSVAVTLAAFLLARAGQLDGRTALTVCLQTGLRNTATPIFVAVTLLSRPDISVPAVVYTITAFATAAAAIALSRNGMKARHAFFGVFCSAK